MMRPDLKTIPVTANGFRSLVMALPEKVSKEIKNEIDCGDFVIKFYGDK
jgi:hypothetical protein